MVAPQLAILAVILPLESSRILGSAAIDAAGRGRTLLCALALEADFVSGEVRLLGGLNGFIFSALFPWVGQVSIFLRQSQPFNSTSFHSIKYDAT